MLTLTCNVCMGLHIDMGVFLSSAKPKEVTKILHPYQQHRQLRYRLMPPLRKNTSLPKVEEGSLQWLKLKKDGVPLLTETHITPNQHFFQ